MPAAVAMCLALVFGTGWAAAQAFVSPAQRAAAAKAPPAGPITATVVEQALTRSISSVATIQAARTRTVVLDPGQGRGVVTRETLPPGDPVKTGTVALEVSGQPIITILGAFPLYRELTAGDTGPDVRMVQRALKEADFLASVTGSYDEATTAGIRAAYARAGYARSGTSIPISSVVVLPEGKWVLSKAPALGTVLSGESALTFADGELVAHVDTSGTALTSVEVGMTGTIIGPDGTSLAARVSAIQSATESAKGGSVDLAPLDAMPKDWRGTEGTATLNISMVSPKALVVPSVALAAHGTDTAVVLVRKGDRFVETPVRELANLNGLSAVKPLHGGLRVGDEVRVE